MFSKKKETIYTKQQLISSERYKSSEDILQVLLKDDEMYSLEVIEQFITQFMKGKVN